MCTLRNFPYLISHCIEWARSKFFEVFVKPSEFLCEFKANSEKTKEKIKRRMKEEMSEMKEL